MTVNASVTFNNAPLTVRVRKVCSVFLQPNVYIFNLNVRTCPLNRERDAVHTSVCKSNPAARNNRNTVVVGITVVVGDDISRVGSGSSLVLGTPKRSPIAERTASTLSASGSLVTLIALIALRTLRTLRTLNALSSLRTLRACQTLRSLRTLHALTAGFTLNALRTS
jgi:hypothetical protein